LGVQFVLMGLVAELVIRTYFESQGKPPYIVRQKRYGDERMSSQSAHHVELNRE